MNVTFYITKGYGKISKWAICENEPKTNPIYRGVASGEAGTNPISEAKNDRVGDEQKDLENKG